MIGRASNSLSDLMSQRAAQLHRLALSQAMDRMTRTGRGRASVSSSPAFVASISLDATLAALNAETAAGERAISLSSAADGAMAEVSELLSQAKALNAAMGDSTLSDTERDANQLELDAILSSIDRLAGSSTLNGHHLLDGSLRLTAAAESFSVNAVNASKLGKSEFDGSEYYLGDLQTGHPLGGNTEAGAKVIAAAIKDLATWRGRLGAFTKDALRPRLVEIASQRAHLLATTALLEELDVPADPTLTARAGMLSHLNNPCPKPQLPRIGGTLDIRA